MTLAWKWGSWFYYAPNVKEVEGGILLLGYASIHDSVHSFVTLFDTCHILWIMQAKSRRLCNFIHVYMDSSWKNGSPYFFSCPSYIYVPLFEKVNMKSCQQDISKIIWARGLKLGLLIGDDESITLLTFEQIPSNFSGIAALANLGILNLSARYFEKLFELGAWNLVSW